eukprot:Gregarina_sp_Poly_1__670@NODE_115_length_13858_cov_166_056486_g102_i0_p3_GENE_NODE_115_length_13858_cov_166_056486_g102_i0NODE_115_length_13858_cov_166_056486_g102_i0_p3_ORF_typecomplete_len500_score84_87NMD3/PF04981_13/0_13Znribbon_8/PF09723_10/2_NODE_115_length_13858_cov_166_056486_g102_i019173416
MNLSSEELRKSFQEKLEAFKAMERQFTPQQKLTPGRLAKNPPMSPSGFSQPISSASSMSLGLSKGKYENKNLISSNLRSQTIDTRRPCSSREQRASRKLQLESKPRLGEAVRKTSICSSCSERTDPIHSQPSVPTEQCPACDAIERSERWQTRITATAGFLRAANQRLTAISKCLESGRALNDFYREKHPFVSELAEEARNLRRMREATPSSNLCQLKSPVVSGLFCGGGSPSTTASSTGGAGGLFSNAAFFSRRTIGTAFSAISTPLKDRLTMTHAKRPVSPPAPQQGGLHSMLMKSQSLIETSDLSPGRQMLERQKLKLIQTAFQQPTPNASRNSPTPEKVWKPVVPTGDANSPLPLQDQQVTSPPSFQPASTPLQPWSSLIEATKSTENSNSSNVPEGVSPPPLLKKSSLPVIDCEKDWQICTLLDIMLDQYDLITQLNGFNGAILQEMKTIQCGMEQFSSLDNEIDAGKNANRTDSAVRGHPSPLERSSSYCLPS